MLKEITVVTAFFNINRENWKNFERSEDKYYEYFTGWAKIKNKLVVYVETERMRERIMQFRNSLGLGDRTSVNLIDDYQTLDTELYTSIVNATNNRLAQLYRLRPENPEVWNANYNFVMLLKMWCVKDAVFRKQASGMVAWIDFGYNHGGTAIDINSNFNFLWEYDFPEKINLFYVQKPNDRPIFDIVFLMDTYIMGTIIVGPADLWDEFWLLMKQSMIALNDCGITDDDQNIILMCYRKQPKLFELFESKWQLPMWQFGGKHLNLVNRVREDSLFHRVGRKIKKWTADLRYALKIYKHLRKVDAH